MIEKAEQQIAEPDANHEPRKQQHEVGTRPGGALEVAQPIQIHRDEERREKAARGDRVHHDRQQRNTDYGETAAKRPLHEADQEYPGKGDQDRRDGQFHRSASAFACALNARVVGWLRNTGIVSFPALAPGVRCRQPERASKRALWPAKPSRSRANGI
ncbi:hypothetical protein D9M69_557240 [compost metagenome]